MNSNDIIIFTLTCIAGLPATVIVAKYAYENDKMAPRTILLFSMAMSIIISVCLTLITVTVFGG